MGFEGSMCGSFAWVLVSECLILIICGFLNIVAYIIILKMKSTVFCMIILSGKILQSSIETETDFTFQQLSRSSRKRAGENSIRLAGI